MNEFDLYWGFIGFDESDDGKNRPVVIIEIEDAGNDLFLVPVYSFRRYFIENYNQRRYYEIQDTSLAGLDKRSFVDIDRADYFNKTSIQLGEKIGHLSERDIDGLLEFMERNI
jgi:hypothetical protein